MGMVRNAIIYVVTVPQSLTLLRGQLKHMQRRGISARVATSPGPEIGPFEGARACRSTRWTCMPRHAAARSGGRVGVVAAVSARAAHRCQCQHPQGRVAGNDRGVGGACRRALLRDWRIASRHGRGWPLLRWTEKVACLLAHRVICISPSLNGTRRAALPAGETDRTGCRQQQRRRRGTTVQS